jgi:hypothetical protein
MPTSQFAIFATVATIAGAMAATEIRAARTVAATPVIGYDYMATGDQYFADLEQPIPPKARLLSIQHLPLELPGFSSYNISAGIPFDLPAVDPSGFLRLGLRGVEPAWEITQTDSFPVAFQFLGSGSVSVKSTAILAPAPAVPGPLSIATFAVGFSWSRTVRHRLLRR